MAYKVMAADDEPIMRKAMSSLVNWKEMDCELVYIASNGQEIIDRLELLAPDILILDIRMPGKSGIDVARYVWENKLTARVILLTAYADFSYAQLAIKYDVVDFVVKTGAFEGLMAAVGKAKEKIRKESILQKDENTAILRENFFKSVFDGSLYEVSELEEAVRRLNIPLWEGYLVMLVHLRMEDMESEKKQRNYKSMVNFLHMVFGEQMLQGLAVRKNMIAIVLSQTAREFEEDIRQKCMQIIDMMDNFMNMYIYIGISERAGSICRLKEEFDRAEFAVGQSFFDQKSKIIFYRAVSEENKDYFADLEKKQEMLYYLIKKGEVRESLNTFHQMTELQRQSKEPAAAVLNTGNHILTWCRKLLAEYDKDIYDFEPYRGNVSSQVSQCRHVKEYTEIMDSLIESTAQWINTAVSRKNILIYECEKYIEENYEKCISVADISKTIGASPSYLSRIFKESTGNTIIYSINQKKVEKAKEYLSNTNMKIYEIADALGFENTTYFSHFFKKHTGMTPKDCKQNET